MDNVCVFRCHTYPFPESCIFFWPKISMLQCESSSPRNQNGVLVMIAFRLLYCELASLSFITERPRCESVTANYQHDYLR